jgi:hypothetical protein
LQAVSRSTTSLRKKLFCKDMQDRIRYMHEILSQVARSARQQREVPMDGAPPHQSPLHPR